MSNIFYIKNYYSIILLLVIFSFQLQAQDLEPRFLSSVPLKANYAGIVYGYSYGNIILNAQEIENLNAKLNSVVAFYGHSLKVFNKPSKLDVIIPYSFGKLNASISQVDTTAYRNGIMDPSLRFSMILIGEKALNIPEFNKREKKKFKMGASFLVKPPLGLYDETKLINLGSNRWSFQLKAASQYRLSNKIIFELHIASWFYTENTSFFNGNTLKQEPLLSAQFHMAYIFNPKLWISASIGQLALGETSINDIEQDDDIENSKVGVTASYRLNKLGSLKFTYTNGLFVASVQDFRTFLIGYSFLWLN